MKIISALEKKDNGNLQLTITLPWNSVKKAYDQVLKNKAAKVTIAGFRQGKAPLNLVKKTVGLETLLRETLQAILPEAYLQAVKEHQLKPIVQPKIQVRNMAEGQDWRLEATTAEKPKITLGNYQETVKKGLKEVKIWVPGKEEKKEEKKEEEKSESEKLSKLFAVLLKTVKISLPQILIEQEVNRQLASLLEQIDKLGLTLEAYLNSIQKTVKQLRQEYQERAERTLKIDFILAAIAEDLKIQVDNKEVEEMIEKTAKTKEEKAKLKASQYYFASLLRRRKTLDKLLAL